MVTSAMDRLGIFELVAACDLRDQALDSFKARYGGRTYRRVEDLCDDPQVEAVWISTPTTLHCEHVQIAAARGKHMVVEKPMAVRVDEAEAMVAAAEAHGVKLMCGNSAVLLPSFRAMRQVIASGAIGGVQAINVWAYNDWMFRPRRPEELPTEVGGGVPYVMAPHQIDVVRLLGGGMARSVRAMTGAWMQDIRPGVGYYVAFIEFASGAAATLLYNGYGYFNTLELAPWAGPPRGLAATSALRRSLRTGQPVDDAREKEATRFGERKELQYHGAAEAGARRGAPQGFQPDCGMVIASCEAGDLRQAPEGDLWVYDDAGTHQVKVTSTLDQRESEAFELYDAVVNDHEPVHNGRWGLGTIEVTDALLRSAATHREVELTRQGPSWEERRTLYTGYPGEQLG
jgi:phthalate 4,5-cis-dihydrodiol dehydrogenase